MMETPGGAACWAFTSSLNQLLYGFYPNEIWRINLSFVLLFVALAPVLIDRVPFRNSFHFYRPLSVSGWLANLDGLPYRLWHRRTSEAWH